MTRDQAIDALLDKQAITETLHLYARGWDRRDIPLIRSCFHPDAIFTHAGEGGPVSQFLDGWVDGTAHVVSMKHMISNVLIDLRGDAAIVESHYLSHHRRPATADAPARDWFIAGRYLDRFERRGGVWKIAIRNGLPDYERLVDVAEESLHTLRRDQLGQFGEQDLLYRMLKA